jgi:hypothetical protein
MSPSPVVCPRCSTPFECGIGTGACWCKAVTLSDATRTAFSQYYDGCLCHDCLHAVEDDRPQAPTVRAFLASQLRRKRTPKA